MENLNVLILLLVVLALANLVMSSVTLYNQHKHTKDNY